MLLNQGVENFGRHERILKWGQDSNVQFDEDSNQQFKCLRTMAQERRFKKFRTRTFILTAGWGYTALYGQHYKRNLDLHNLKLD